MASSMVPSSSSSSPSSARAVFGFNDPSFNDKRLRFVERSPAKARGGGESLHTSSSSCSSLPHASALSLNAQAPPCSSSVSGRLEGLGSLDDSDIDFGSSLSTSADSVVLHLCHAKAGTFAVASRCPFASTAGDYPSLLAFVPPTFSSPYANASTSSSSNASAKKGSRTFTQQCSSSSYDAADYASSSYASSPSHMDDAHTSSVGYLSSSSHHTNIASSSSSSSGFSLIAQQHSAKRRRVTDNASSPSHSHSHSHMEDDASYKGNNMLPLSPPSASAGSELGHFHTHMPAASLSELLFSAPSSSSSASASAPMVPLDDIDALIDRMDSLANDEHHSSSSSSLEMANAADGDALPDGLVMPTLSHQHSVTSVSSNAYDEHNSINLTSDMSSVMCDHAPSSSSSTSGGGDASTSSLTHSSSSALPDLLCEGGESDDHRSAAAAETRRRRQLEEERERELKWRQLQVAATADAFLSLDDDDQAMVAPTASAATSNGGANGAGGNLDGTRNNLSVTLHVSNFLLSSHSGFFRAILNQKEFAERACEVPEIHVAEGMLPTCVELIKYLCAGCQKASFPTFTTAPEFARMLLLADFLDVPDAFGAACRSLVALDHRAEAAPMIGAALLRCLPDAVRRRKEFTSTDMAAATVTDGPTSTDMDTATDGPADADAPMSVAAWIKAALRPRYARPMIDVHVGCLTVEALGFMLEWDELHVITENETFILLEYWQSRNVAVDASSLLAKFRFPQMSASFVADVVRKSSLFDPTKRYHDYLAPLLLVAEAFHKMSAKEKAEADYEKKFRHLVPWASKEDFARLFVPRKKHGRLAQICANCRVSRKEERLKMCGHCRLIRYCSVDCQRSHWRTFHREVCRQLAVAKQHA